MAIGKRDTERARCAAFGEGDTESTQRTHDRACKPLMFHFPSHFTTENITTSQHLNV